MPWRRQKPKQSASMDMVVAIKVAMEDGVVTIMVATGDGVVIIMVEVTEDGVTPTIIEVAGLNRRPKPILMQSIAKDICLTDR